MTSIRPAVLLAFLALIGASSTPNNSSLSQRPQAGPMRVAGGVVQPVAAVAPMASTARARPVAAPVVQAAVTAAMTAVAPMSAVQQSYFDQLRARLRFVDVRYGDKMLRTPDDVSRLMLVTAAARHAGLSDVGLGYYDVYGVIEAETSWIPRVGFGKDGTPSYGLAQFEAATARAVGLTNPNDPVEAVHAAALHLKEAAQWSARRIASLKLEPNEYASKLREGISIYYNLSSKGRSKWTGLNTAKLPVETQRHIRNTELGAREAAELAAQLQRIRGTRDLPGTLTAGLTRSGS